MRLCLGILVVSCAIACGESDDDGGRTGAGGTAGGGGTGASSTGGTASGGASGASTGGNGGSGGSAGSVAVGGAAGSSSLCSATTMPYDTSSIDCDAACDHFESFGSTGPCGNPYVGKHAECVISCNATKGTLAYTNALYGCAAENTECNQHLACMDEKCG